MPKKVIKKAKKIASKVDMDPTAIVKVGESQLKAFIEFIKTQGVVGLAIGLVLGGSVSVLVKSLVDNIVMPPIGLLLGSAEGLKGLSWTIGATTDGQASVLRYGIFLNDFINFVVIAAVVYMLVTLFKIENITKKK